ncbi:MAG: branched-chain amino acid ABC transporter permease, partial [Candidatus Rokubacteria bacterium]|nr:branched-chain amino acid ABC transporter permease [Candidatus Rokubacteria bacterium]
DPPKLGPVVFSTDRSFFYIVVPAAVLFTFLAKNIVRTRVGRAFIAIRDNDISAEAMGINIFRYKLLAFAISSFYAGVTGVLYTYYLGIANYEQFQITVSIDYLAMIIIGGLGSVLGSIFGAIFVTLLPIVIRLSMEAFGGLFFSPAAVLNIIPNLRLILFGALIVFFLVVEPEGLNRLWRNVRSYFRFWPFAY